MTQGVADFSWDSKTGDYFPQLLTGKLFLNESQHKVLMRLVQGVLFAGGDRTRGYGELKVSIEEAQSLQNPDLIDWSTRFKAKVSILTEGRKEDMNGCFFTVNLESDAILVTCCCSGLISPAMLEDLLAQLAVEQRREIQILERLGQAPDHPVSVTCPESNYLKCLISRVL